MSQLTTHVLDTSLGRPAAGICITLFKGDDMLAQGTTNQDGRVSDLLADDQILPAGEYRLCFELTTYLEQHNQAVFYPRANIEFMIDSADHYHIPLLLSPYGYSTYRGS